MAERENWKCMIELTEQEVTNVYMVVGSKEKRWNRINCIKRLALRHMVGGGELMKAP